MLSEQIDVVKIPKALGSIPTILRAYEQALEQLVYLIHI